MNTSIHQKIAFLLFLLLTGMLAGYLVKEYKTSGEVLEVVDLGEVECNSKLSECNIQTKEFGLNIELPSLVQYLHPFGVKIVSKSQIGDIRKITLQFLMVGMDMGLNVFDLKEVQSQPVDNRNTGMKSWKTEAVLPFCVTGRVDWKMQINVIYKDSIYKLLIPVTVTR